MRIAVALFATTALAVVLVFERSTLTLAAAALAVLVAYTHSYVRR